ncbi:class I SAM-dependent methyltransferase [bacterium]|nr:class I SAM-dependent methyltransferase [bacterium]
MSVSYAGKDILEVMTEAKNYNAFLENSLLKNLKGKTVLDFGAGQGQFAIPLKKKGFSVECIEPDESLFATLKNQSFVVYKNISEAPQYENIYSINVLEHIEHDSAAAQQLVEHLKPGGRLIIYVPAFQTLYSSLDEKIGHHRRYTKKTLKALFPELRILECRYVDSLGFAASLYLKWFHRSEGQISVKMVHFYDQCIFPFSQIIDHLSHPFWGKNLLLVAEKPTSHHSP